MITTTRARGLVLGLLLALTTAPAAPAALAAPTAPDDWSKAVVDSTMKRHTPATLGGWSYTRGLYLYGQYLVYKRTGEKKYFDYIKAWVDRFVNSNGEISNNFTNLDSMRAATLLIILHTETGQAKYKKAADKLRNRFPGYPRTSDGGMFHAASKVGQLWADGVYMAQPFIAGYAKQYNETYGYDEAVRNLAAYFKNLKRDNGLLWHAYDEDGSEPWAKNPGRHSAEHWARAIGWFGMTAIDILEVLPANHPRRAEVIAMVQHLARGYQRYQDAATGRWFQVVDKPTANGNWTETSASAMYTFMISRGVERGYLDASLSAVSRKGYQGVLAKASLGSDGLTNIKDISEGTNVGNLSYYLARPRNTNDFHGLGAFLIMNEQLRKTGA
ncbi:MULTISPECIES: glycoside hydrolase family 88 protein [unclassified Crossiella]|uniref:glycoside hydrolase family 88/105 protein n=1 Tax=unclassified Crossiella TaxID=2620835 RepID=UPI001FFFE0BE|nr:MULTISPECIES: glycoside hydrolase family 88 protein [unclassified Crossiella]MCK2245039.1 glycoside hydrolase family 88 protein [Crossiella sp. S99.2]MCK2258620.1 glycoside hydrolase family 88 protein [Crossiella sp. S99.1]